MKFIKSNWKLLAIIGLILGAVFYVRGLHSQVEHWRGEYNELSKEMETCKRNTAALTLAVEEQNAAVDALAQKSLENEKIVDQAIKDRDAIKKEYDKKIQDIIMDVTPKDCEASIEYLIKGTKDLKW